jgi:hypothetical protein
MGEIIIRHPQLTNRAGCLALLLPDLVELHVKPHGGYYIVGPLASATCEGTDRFSGRTQAASVANRLPLVICAKLTNVSLPAKIVTNILNRNRV